MSIPERYKYPFDKTGESPDNRVYPEKHALTKSRRVIVPKEGPYFTKSLVITFKGKALVRGVDYKPAFLMERATVRTNKEVCGGIKITNDKIVGEVTLLYQVVGGELGNHTEANRQLAEVLDGNNGAIRWDQIINVPEFFTPPAHLHHVDDLVGITPIVIVLQGIKQAIENLRSHRNVALYRLIGSIHTRVNNFIEAYNTNDTYVRDTLADLVQRVGIERLVSETKFNTAKRELDRRIDSLSTKVDTFVDTLSARLSTISDQINGVEARSLETEAKVNEIKTRLDRFTVTGRYAGSRENGQFITVSKVGDVVTITQTDPSWLAPTLDRITSLEGSSTTLTDSLNALTTRVTAIEGELPTFRGYSARIDANKRLIDTNQTAMTRKVDEEVQRLGAEDTRLAELINVNKADTETKLTAIRDSIVPTIDSKLEPYEARFTSLEERTGNVEGEVSTLRQKEEAFEERTIARENELAESIATNLQTQQENNRITNRRIDDIDVTLTFEQRQGEVAVDPWMSLEKSNKVFKLKYQTPSWKATLDSAISELQSANTASAEVTQAIQNRLNTAEQRLGGFADLDGRVTANTQKGTELETQLSNLTQQESMHYNELKQSIQTNEAARVNADRTHTNDIASLKRATDGLNVTARYIGSVLGTGNWFRAERTGNAFSILLDDFPFLTETQTKLHELTETNTEQNNRLAALENAGSNHVNSTDNLRAEIAELKRSTTSLNETTITLTTGLAGERTRATEKENVLQALLDALRATVSDVSNSVQPKIDTALREALREPTERLTTLETTAIPELKEKDIELQERIDSVASSVRELNDGVQPKIDAHYTQTVKPFVTTTVNEAVQRVKDNELVAINNSLTSLDGRITQNTNNLTALTRRVTNAETAQRNTTTDLTATKARVTTLEGEREAVQTRLNELDTGLTADKEDLRRYKEAVNELFEAVNQSFTRYDGHYLGLSTIDGQEFPKAHVEIESNEVSPEEVEQYETTPRRKYVKQAYPYSRFQSVEIGVEVKVKQQATKVKLGYGCLINRHEFTNKLTDASVSLCKNQAFELVSIRREQTNGGDTLIADMGNRGTYNGRQAYLIYPKSGIVDGDVSSFQFLTPIQAISRGNTLTVNAGTNITLVPKEGETYILCPLGIAEAEEFIHLSEEVSYTNGDWVGVKARIEGGWWSSDTGEVYSGTTPFKGTNFILPGLTLTTGAWEGVEIRNFYVRPVDGLVNAETLPGMKDYLDRWFNKKLAANENLPRDSRWDISRFRIQPGAETFSSVTVDENDNLQVQGIVYYDTVGKGRRGVFAPTTEVTLTQTQTWSVPDEYDGRVALVTVRADSFTQLNRITHSAVRQMMVTLTGGTEIPIQVGPISSFGTHVTVSNAIDYPDAIVGRIESPSGTKVNPGMVSIKV